MGSKQTDFARSSRHLFVPRASSMVAARIRYEEGSYEGEINEAKNPEGQGTFEYRGDDEAARLMYDGGWKDKAGNRHGPGELVKADGEVRSEEYKEGKLIKFTITKEKTA